MKAPVDIALGDEEPVGKALLRWHEFLEQRGLSEEPNKLLLGEPEGRADLEASDEPAPEGMALPSAAGGAGVDGGFRP